MIGSEEEEEDVDGAKGGVVEEVVAKVASKLPVVLAARDTALVVRESEAAAVVTAVDACDVDDRVS